MNEILTNPLCWFMFVVAAASYYYSFVCLFSEQVCPKVMLGLDTAQVLTAALPLLGLLGTIVGLLQSFNALSLGLGADSASLTAGIADALYTTELGLLLAIPGWLLGSQKPKSSGALN
ncbi:MotA/TolQ/ExbB proton channel family protein [Pseudoalteromonas xiamenensis]|uniref:MotA/TolQ/ExbB proton channel family protein n=1 Tax=Pseudoalteromonas xiamenensis TaxID=882626 RepID=UPI0027E5221B|nr:MotA/TolQ/ExbB proton channel family protein [Pseudoalteromonas xiamenensis]WMN59637.1 MotA/TolQ/ExbB proton channel family protein [Pseudoalteromonas xiamenensis]